MSAPDLSLVDFWREQAYRPSDKWISAYWWVAFVMAQVAALFLAGVAAMLYYGWVQLLVPATMAVIVFTFCSAALFWQHARYKHLLKSKPLRDVPPQLCPTFFKLNPANVCVNDKGLSVEEGNTKTLLGNISVGAIQDGSAVLADYPIERRAV